MFERSPIDCSPLTTVQHGELVLFWAHRVLNERSCRLRPAQSAGELQEAKNETRASNCATASVWANQLEIRYLGQDPKVMYTR